MADAANLNGSYDDWKPSFSPWIIAIAVMLAAFMEILDTTVANVALPHMAGSFSASNDEATWVLTSYLVSNAIILPATAWFSTLLGRKKFLTICVVLFTFSSFMCGISNSLDFLIVARIFQGIGGGALQPLSQAILLESFPKHMRGVAMAVFGFGVIFAPIIGPTLGGWITDNYTWRWVFYINIPIGILAVFLISLFVEDPPYIKNVILKKIDYIGFGLLALWLATLQILLDKGQQLEWFSSSFICWFAAISVISFLIFILWELKSSEPIVNLRIMKDRNFAIGAFLIIIVGGVLYGTLTMLPLFLQTLMGYSAELSGLALSPRGIGSLFAIIVAGRIINKVDNRILTALGFLCLSVSSFALSDISLNIGISNVIIPNILNGIGLGLIFIPLSNLAFSSLKVEELGNATGIFNLMRNIGGSVGISITSSLLSSRSQIHQASMIAHLTPYDTVLQQKTNLISHVLALKSGTVVAAQQAQGVIYGMLVKQANLWGFVDNFRIYSIVCLVLIPLIFLFKKVNYQKKEVSLH